MPLILVASVICLLFLGVPVAVALAAASIFFFAFIGQIPLEGVVHRMVGGLDMFPLLAVPLFMLAGEIMNVGGITDRIFRLANNLVGHIRGGLGMVNVLDSMIFAGMSGSGLADAVGFGAVEIQAMKRRGYTSGFSAAITASSATIGPIIPPSIPFVVYGGITGVSIGRLFIGGAIPGVLMGLCLMIGVYWIAVRRNYPSEPRPKFRELCKSVYDAGLALFLPLIIVGGILAGVFTPTEAAVVAVLYALVVAVFVYKELALSEVPRLLSRVGAKTASVLIIVAAASPFGWLMAWQQIPQTLLMLFTSLTDSPWMFLLILNVFLLILGCFMEGMSLLIILSPVLLPVVRAYNIDLVHFGVLFVLNIMIGTVTPPFGMHMYVTCALAKCSIAEFVRENTVFLIGLLVALVLVTYVPAITLALPNALLGLPLR